MAKAAVDPDDVRAALGAVFERNFRERGEIGASVSVWQDGEEIVSLAQGHATRDGARRWDGDTIIPVWSATKGPSSVACLLALDQVKLPLDAPVSEVWPRFAASGKERVTFKHLLEHTAGLSAIDVPASMLDYAGVIASLEQQAPAFEPGTQVAYHARTFGFLLDEVVRRITGAASLGAFFRERIGAPMDLDFWIGLPEREHHRVGMLYAGRMRPGAAEDPFMKAFGTPGSMTRRAFASPSGFGSVQEMNRPEAWTGGFASMGGTGTAGALAKFYSMLASGGIWKGRQLVPRWCVDALGGETAQGHDAVLCAPVAFAAGMMRDPVNAEGAKERQFFGSSRAAFGHPGAGGSLAFADPERGIGFAYLMNQMETGALPGPKALDLVAALDEATA
jgi:CubicO group peptidase (beta-lactamase class C family)